MRFLVDLLKRSKNTQCWSSLTQTTGFKVSSRSQSQASPTAASLQRVLRRAGEGQQMADTGFTRKSP